MKISNRASQITEIKNDTKIGEESNIKGVVPLAVEMGDLPVLI